MKKSWLVLLASLGVFVAGCAVMADGARAVQPGDLSGTWAPMKNEMGGKALTLPSGFELRIEGDRYRAGIPPNYNDFGRIEFVAGDTSTAHRQIDIKGEVGANKGKSIPAIARMNGNELEICYDLSQKERPTDFVSREGTSQFRVTYQKK